MKPQFRIFTTTMLAFFSMHSACSELSSDDSSDVKVFGSIGNQYQRDLNCGAIKGDLLYTLTAEVNQMNSKPIEKTVQVEFQELGNLDKSGPYNIVDKSQNDSSYSTTSSPNLDVKIHMGDYGQSKLVTILHRINGAEESTVTLPCWFKNQDAKIGQIKNPTAKFKCIAKNKFYQYELEATHAADRKLVAGTEKFLIKDSKRTYDFKIGFENLTQIYGTNDSYEMMDNANVKFKLLFKADRPTVEGIQVSHSPNGQAAPDTTGTCEPIL